MAFNTHLIIELSHVYFHNQSMSVTLALFINRCGISQETFALFCYLMSILTFSPQQLYWHRHCDGCKIYFLLDQKVKKLKFLQSDIQTFTQIKWLKIALRFNQSPSPNFIFMFCFLNHLLSLYICYFQPVGPGT